MRSLLLGSETGATHRRSHCRSIALGSDHILDLDVVTSPLFARSDIHA
jgi:hypothetical protein